MSDVEIKVGKNITVSLDYEEYHLDENQARDLWNVLGEALGIQVSEVK